MSPRRAVVKVSHRCLEQALGLHNSNAKILAVVSSDPLTFCPTEFHILVESDVLPVVLEGTRYPERSLSVHRDQQGELFAVFK